MAAVNKKKKPSVEKKDEDKDVIKENPYKNLQPDSEGPYTEIFLIRHCRQDYSKQEKLPDAMVPLSKRGIKERAFLTERLLKMNINSVYASSLKRAQESALEFLDKTKKKLNVEPGLNEIDWLHWRNIKYFNMSEEGRKKRFAGHKELDKQ